MGNTKTEGNDDDPSLAPLCKTLAALKDIRAALLPFLSLLADGGGGDASSGKKRSRPTVAAATSASPTLNPRRRAEAEAAAALAIGTLRYMAARLRGQDRGRKKGDPLRSELDKIRGTLVALRKLEDGAGRDKGKGADVRPSSMAASNLDEKKSTSRATTGKPSPRENSLTSGGVAKRTKVVDMEAGGRMIKAALAGDELPAGSTPSAKRSRHR